MKKRARKSKEIKEKERFHCYSTFPKVGRFWIRIEFDNNSLAHHSGGTTQAAAPSNSEGFFLKSVIIPCSFFFLILGRFFLTIQIMETVS